MFTVGYEHIGAGGVIALARQLDATVIDVRSVAWGRVQRGTARADLGAALGTRYAWLGALLGGRGAGPSQEGITQIASRCLRGERLLLLCLEHWPEDCHRHRAIALPLLRQGIDLQHLVFYEDGPAEAILSSQVAGEYDVSAAELRALALLGGDFHP